MTTAYVTIEPTEFPAVPGAEQTIRVTVRNAGSVVESYDLHLLGDLGPWATVEPPTLTLYPGTEEQALVRLRPPRTGAIPVGPSLFAVQVAPSGRLDEAVAPEGVADIQPFTDPTVELTPRTSRGWRRGRHEVAVDNRGNVPMLVELGTAEPDDELAVRIRPTTLEVPPGQTAFAAVTVRPARLLWSGRPQTQPFRLLARTGPAVDDVSILDGRCVQKPVFAKGTARLLAGVAAVAVLCAGAWYLLLRPAVRSAAQDAVDTPLAKLASVAGRAQHRADEANHRIDEVRAHPSGSPAAPPPPKTPTPFTVRLDAQAAAGNTSALSSYGAPTDRALNLTDLFLENPQGDTGRVDVIVNSHTVLTLSLVNFRDNDYHFVTPIQVPAGKTFGIRTACQTPGPPIAGSGAGQCRVALVAGGVVQP